MKKILLFFMVVAFVNNASALLSTPTLVSPSDGAINQYPNVTIDWSSVTGATSYELKLATISDLSDADTQTVTNSCYYTSELFFNTTYYWQVRAKSASDSSDWSSTRSFTVRSTITLSSPNNGATNQNPNVTIWINTINGVTHYDYELDTTEQFNSPELREYSHITGYSGKVTDTLLFGKTYYWRARARHAADTSEWSSIRNFTVRSTVSLSSPNNGATNQNPNVSIYISAFNGVTHYDYELDTTELFNSPELREYSHTSEYGGKVTDTLLFGKTYYWRARARHAVDTSDWSSIRNFTVRSTVSLSSPGDGATNQNPNVSLYISTFSGVTHYDYELDTTDLFNSPELREYSHTSDYSGKVTDTLLFGKTYYWRARARHSVDTSDWSSIRNFIVKSTVSLSSPSDGATNQNPNVTLYINTFSGVTDYDYEIDTTDLFNSVEYRTYTHTSGYNGKVTDTLLFGATYYWRARARHSVDTSDWSSARNFTVKSTVSLSSPSNGATNQNPNVTIDWNTVYGITYYDYEVDTTSDFNSSMYQYNSVSSASSQASLSELLFGATYYWRVRTRHSTDTSDWSSYWNFTTKNSLSLTSPSNGTTNQNPNVTINWNTVSGITYYDYEVDTTTDFNSSLLLQDSTPSGSSQTTLSELLFGTTYYWRVRTRHSADTSDWSSCWNFTTKNSLGLTSPGNGATNQNPNTTINWDYMSGITYYDYEVDTTSDFNSSLLLQDSTASGSSQTTLSELLFGTTYYWRVRTRHSADTSDWSSCWNFTTKNSLGLTSPNNGATNQNPNTIINWDYMSGITYYDYEVDTTSDFNSSMYQYNSVSSASSQATLSELLFGTTYYWRARARHSTDTTEWSSCWSFTVTNGVSLVSPANNSTGLSINPTIDWSYMSNITNYNYQYDTDSDFSSPEYFSIPSTSSQANLSGLSYGTKYYWQVRVVHASDTSDWSAPWAFTTEYELVNEPDLVSPANSASIVASKVKLEWGTVTGAEHYEYQYDTLDTFTNPVSEITTELSDSTDYLIMGKTYYWRARGGNGNGNSPWSDTWSFTTELPASPSLISPDDEAIEQSTTSLVFDWSNVSDVTGYEFQYSSDITFTTYIDSVITSSTITVESLDYFITYYWRVKTIKDDLMSNWSDVWSFTTAEYIMEVPSLISPADNSIYQSIDGLVLDWNDIANISSFEIDYATDINFTENLISENTSISELTINGLAFLTTYYWRVRSKDEGYYSEWSLIFSFTTSDNYLYAPLLTSPSDESINQEIDNLNLNWDDVTTASSYEINYATDINFTENLVSNTSSVSEINISELDYNTIYYWRVRAKDDIYYSEWSSVFSFKTEMEIPVLVSPANESINQAINSLVLNWDDVGSFSVYEINYATDVNFTENLISKDTNISELTIDDLAFLTTYYWRVRSKDGSNYSDWSNVWSFTTAEYIMEVPSLISPTDNSIYQPVNDLTLDWSIIDDAISYDIEYATDINFTENLISENSVNSEITINGLNYYTDYYWRVMAKNDTYTSEWSTIFKFTTELEIPVLVSPANESAGHSVSSLILDWNDIANISSFEIDYATDINFTENLISEDTSISELTIDDLAFLTTYYWRVRSKDEGYYSEWSSVFSFTTEIEIPVLVSPANGSLTQPFNDLLLDWNDVTNISSFDINYATDIDFTENLVSKDTNISELIINVLDYNTTYYWKVRSNDGANYSDWSSIFEFTTKTEIPVLNSPENESINKAINNLVLNWDDVGSFSLYEINYATDVNFTENLISTTSSVSELTINDLDYYTTYYWRVCSKDGLNYSDWSSTFKFTTEFRIPVLISPEDKSINQSINNLVLNWNNVENISSYEINYATDSNFTQNLISNTTSVSEITIESLEYYTLYYWKVRSKDGENYSNWSSVFSFTTELEIPELISPANESINQAFINLQLNWNDVPNISTYEINYATDNNFTENLISDTVSASELILDTLESNTRYFWKARSKDGNNYSDWSIVYNFTTGTTFLEAPQLITPENGITNQSFDTLFLDWNDVNNANGYVINYSTNIDFTENLIVNSSENSDLSIYELAYNTIYFWRVKAYNDNSESSWSDIWYFSTKDSTSNILSINDNNAFVCYPNPTNGLITVEFANISINNERIIKIYNIFGQELYNIQSKNSNEVIDLSDYDNGIYFIAVVTENKLNFIKIILNK